MIKHYDAAALKLRWLPLLAALGCMPNLAALSAGSVGCRPDEIDISNEESIGLHGMSWTATCAGREYACSGAGQHMSCTALDKHASLPPPPAPKPLVDPEPAPSKWIAQAIAACAIQAEFPGAPTLSSEKTQAPDGTKVMTYSAELVRPDSWSVRLACTKLISQLHPGKWAKVLDSGRDSMLRATQATLVSERPILGGREVVFSVSGEECRARFLIVEDKVILAIVTPVSGFGAQKTARFFRSVELRPE